MREFPECLPAALIRAVPFDVSYRGKTLKCDFVPGCLPLQTVLIHGAGTSERGRFTTLRSALRARGMSSTAFDCIGHGETGGTLQESSLVSRTRQAEAVVNTLPIASPLAIVGTSMGAYNAIKLLETRKLDALVLVVPGVYAPDAYELPFGPEFTAAIRQERSWDATDAWQILGSYTGRLLVIAAEYDAVIPREIPERLVQAARNASQRKLHVVPGAEHNRLFSLVSERPAECAAMMDLIFTFLAISDEERSVNLPQLAGL